MPIQTAELSLSPSARPPSIGGMAGWRLSRVVAFMRAHLAEDIVMADLVTAAGLSRAQFFRAFQQSTGMTPGRYLTRLRVEQARAAIDQAALPPAAAARSVGLGAAGFPAQFRRVFGVTPRAYLAGRAGLTTAAAAAR
jgi:AraC family transcriptional regulator